jgi:hypothetical protein
VAAGGDVVARVALVQPRAGHTHSSTT